MHLLGTAVKLENTYLAIMSRHVSVSSRWRVFKLSSAWAIEFSSADPKLALVRDVWILLEGGVTARSGCQVGAEPSTTGAKAQGMQVLRGLHSERPARACGQSSHSLAKRVDTSSQGVGRQGLMGETQARSSEQRLRRWGETGCPLTEAQKSQVMALWQNSVVMQRHGDHRTHRQRLHSAHRATSHGGQEGSGLCVRLFTHTLGPPWPCPSDQEKGLVQVLLCTNFILPLPSFAHDKEFVGKELKGEPH